MRRPPRGCRCRRAGIASTRPLRDAPRSVSVSTKPGATAFTVTPRRATSDRDRLRHPDQSRLRRGVVRLPGVRARPDDRGDVDYPAEAGPQHRAQARRVVRNAAERLVSITRPSPRRSSCGASPSARMPALLTSTAPGRALLGRAESPVDSVGVAHVRAQRPRPGRPRPRSRRRPLGAVAVGAVVDATASRRRRAPAPSRRRYRARRR